MSYISKASKALIGKFSKGRSKVKETDNYKRTLPMVHQGEYEQAINFSDKPEFLTRHQIYLLSLREARKVMKELGVKRLSVSAKKSIYKKLKAKAGSRARGKDIKKALDSIPF